MSIVIAFNMAMRERLNRKVLIYDEAGFTRICSAVLEMFGCRTDIIMDTDREAGTRLNNAEVGVFITSYPYGAFLLEEVRKRRIPSIVLFDNIGECYSDKLHTCDNLYCMIKPLDYNKFKDLVQQLLSGDRVSREDFTII